MIGVEKRARGPAAGAGGAQPAAEREIAALIAEGLGDEEIGRRIHLALPTVKTHVSRIMDKLGAVDRVQVAVAYLTASSGPDPGNA